MPCDTRARQLAAAEQKRLEEERKRALKEIEDALARGIAKIVKQPDGTFRVIGAALPEGMYDLCVLAKLQERNSVAFRQAMGQAQTQANFMQQHAMAHMMGGHGHGGHGGHGH